MSAVASPNHIKRSLPRAVPTIQLAKIAKVLKRDADAHRLIGGEFLETNKEGEFPTTKAACKSLGRCANGALMFYSKLPLKTLIKLQGQDSTDLPHAFMKREYGLLEIHTEAIIDINDNTYDPQNNGDRYDAVMAMLTFAEMCQQQGIRFDSAYTLLYAYRNPNGWLTRWDETGATT